MGVQSRARCTAQGFAALLLAGSMLGAGCSCREETPAAPDSSASPAASGGAPRPGRAAAVAPAARLAEEPWDSPSLGALHGTILFTGKVPERFLLGAAQKAECTQHGEVDQRSNVVVVNDGKLAGAYVYLKSGYDAHAVPAAPSTPVTLDQRGCMYVPRVVALQLGQKLLVRNSDPTTHNVNLRAKRNASSNRSMGATQAPLEFLFEKREHRIAVQCDIHSWMGAVVFVEEHPWFRVTDEQGGFRIPDVPPGEYVVEAIHESLGSA